EPNTSRRWNVRASPRRARWWALRPETSSPSISTLPAVGSCKPVMTLNNVVLPAPLGPMRPVTRPGSAVRSTSCRAITPPKRTLTSSTDRSDNAVHLLGDLVAGDAGVVCGPSAEPVDRPADLAHDPVRAAGDRHGSQAGAQERDVLDADVLGDDVEARAQQHAAEKRTGDCEDPADGDHQQHHQALDVNEVVAA